MSPQPKIYIAGLGCVGLPLAVDFGKQRLGAYRVPVRSNDHDSQCGVTKALR
jgi:UDP-N-acetyl-D-mannosaminuronate dehydrogenase